MSPADDLGAVLAARWTGRDLSRFASAPAARLMNTPGEWDPPEGVEPKREPLYLSVGIPDSASLPRAQINAAMSRVMASEGDASLRYGFGQGYYPLRAWLAEHYTRTRQMEVGDEWFQLTNGSSGAIDLVVRSLIDPGDVIVTEKPVYMGTLHNFRGVAAEIAPVDMDADGIRADLVDQAITRLKHDGHRVKLIYTISSFQNPTGITLSLERRKALLAVAAQHDVLILDDDAYGELYYDHPPPAPMSSLAEGHGVITVGTFSKTLATGLRVGWIHATPDLIQLFRRMRFAMGQNQMALRMLGELVNAAGYEPHVGGMRSLYKEKMELTTDALIRHAGNFLQFDKPLGGFYLWPSVVGGIGSEPLWRTCMEEGVQVNLGAGFYPDKRDPGEHP
ncbi:MAG: PLP-dependent aminotransferase family protein [Gammaproteobacteria bacterium]